MPKDTKKVNYQIIDAIVKGVKGRVDNVYNLSGMSVGELGGGRFCGQKSKLEIEVESNTPVKILEFDGAWPIEAGDAIRATIKMTKRYCYPVPCSPTKEEARHKLYEKEHPIKIEKIRKQRVVATYINE